MNTFSLQERQILIETVFEHIPQLIFWKNSNSVYLGCNKKYAEFLGLNTPQELVGKTDYDLGWLADGDTAEKFRIGDRQTLAGQHIINEEEWLSVKQGTKILALVNKVPLHNSKGRVIGVLGVATDITEKKHLEEQMAKVEHQLQGMTLVSASIAHEIRTPLAALRNTAKGVKKLLPPLLAGYRKAAEYRLNIPPIPDSVMKLLEQSATGIMRKVDEANQVIDMLLVNIRSLRQEKLIDPQPCSAKHCIDYALSHYALSRDLPKMTWEKSADFIFYGKEMLLVHVLFNLLKNAIYFIRKAGKGQIYIWIESTTQENTIHFKDTGMGIRPENISKIFEPFFTADTNKGTGVGLAFCRMTMQALGGGIRCESQWHEYTEFILTFPGAAHKEDTP